MKLPLMTFRALKITEKEEVKLKTETVEAKEDKKEGAEEKKEPEIEIESNWEEKVDSFDELHLKEDLLRGIYGYGFTKPSPIQQKGILPLLKKKDTIAQVRSFHISYRRNQELGRPLHLRLVYCN